MQFQGAEQFRCTPARLFAALTDPAQFVATIPDLQSSEQIDERRVRCVVRPGFSFLRGTLKLEIEFVDLQPPAAGGPGSAAMRVEAKGIGATINIESWMRVEPAALPDGSAGAALAWDAQVVKLSGLVATVSKPLIQAAAGTVAKDTWQRVRERVEQPEG